MNFFNFERFKPKSSSKSDVLVREPARKRAVDDLEFPQNKNLYLLVAAHGIDLHEFEPTAHKLRLLKTIEASSFRDGAARLESSNDWFQSVPAEWVITEFRPVLERLAVRESIKYTIRNAGRFVKIQVNERFDLSLEGFQLLNSATAHFVKSIKGVLFEPCSFKLYHFSDPQLDAFHTVETGVPSLYPFLSVLTSREDDRCRLTSHGLARFELPEIQLENIPASMSSSCAFLIRAMAQSVIEKVVECKASQSMCLSLAEPLFVSTAAVIKGNRGNLPFDACVPRVAQIAVKLRNQSGTIKLFVRFEGEQQKQDAALLAVLSKLSLLKPGDCDGEAECV